ncbi:MAG: DUF5320 domain-containing protein [Candidatus Bipolaricaulota bacterium]
MPRRDGTGPTGAGSMTGRGMGPCTASSGPDLARGVNRRNPADFSQVRGQNNSLPADRGRARAGARGRGSGGGKGRGRGRSRR